MKFFFFQVFIAALFTQLVLGQNIQGIINDYTVVDSVVVCKKKIIVQNPVNFITGDRVLLIQMKGATINTSNTAFYGTITSLGQSGNYEFGTIKSIVADSIYLQCYTTRSYNTHSGRVQLVRVPVYNTAWVIAPLTAAPWNGSTGGVLALEAASLNLLSNISVDSLGFRGGARNAITVIYNIANCGITTYAGGQGSGNCSGKGEGLIDTVLNQSCGRGSQANGGGGGNNINAGGGGGGCYGLGGQGGNQFAACPSVVTGGQGGKPPYLTSVNQVYLGGGGGAGHQDNSAGATDGGCGGGIIFIKAGTVSGNAYNITANGRTVNGALLDGAGGGGAGGTIVLDVTNYASAVNVEARGADGGSQNAVFNPSCHGPGGGGGGGLIWFSQSALPPLVTTNVSGGQPGTYNFAGANCQPGNPSWGATAGSTGGLDYNLNLSEGLISSYANAGNDTAVCPGQAVTLHGSVGSNYAWTPAAGLTGANTQNPTINNPTANTTYAFSMTNPLGCTDRDTVTVSLKNNSFTISMSSDVTLCNVQQIALSAGGGNYYQWYTSSVPNLSTQSSIVVAPMATTTYYCSISMVPGGTGCDADTGQVVVSFVSPPVVNAGVDLVISSGQSIPLNGTVSGTVSGTTFVWHPGATLSDSTILNPIASPTETTTYSLSVDNGGGCLVSDNVIVEISDAAVLFPSAFSPNADGRNDEFKPLGSKKFIGTIEFHVFNRWAQEVYSSTDYYKGWNGTYNGIAQPVDTYFYTATVTPRRGDDQKFLKGNVTLIR